MNQIVAEKSPSRGVTSPLARISEPHGYRFDGDTVHLRARFAVLNAAADQRDWTLQLWACPKAPVSAGDLEGHLVAQVALPPMSEAAYDSEHMDMSAFACPPSAPGDYVMALALAAGRRPGQTDEIHDVAVYPRRQQFVQPRMRGSVGYRIDGNRVRISVERIENPRSAGNTSGTLALELWALAAPYGGGAFSGVPLAGVAIGPLPGTNVTAPVSFDLPFSQPAAGKWHFVLMLREWTAARYVTRDFTNFQVPASYGATTTDVTRTAAPASAAPAAPPRSVAPAVAAVQPAKPAGAGTQPAKIAATATQPAKPAEAAPTAKPALVTSASAARAVSVNTAPETELASVTGVTSELAKGIVKKRPFTSLDDLRRVKGISLTLLEKIRSRLSL